MKNLKQKIYQWRLKQSRKKNAKTIEVHEFQWHKNLLRNSKNKLFKTAKSIAHITQKIGENRTIWLLGAGYSLEEKKAEFRRILKPTDIIFCVDASLSYVVNEIGVTPDFVFILDSKKEGLRFFKDISDDILKKINVVVSSAVDKEFIPVIERFKEVYAFHMFDPSMPDWGDDSCETSAHKLLPNLNYVPNKGNVFNLALQVAYFTNPKRVIGLGVEHCFKFDKEGKLRTRASVNDGYDYSVGKSFTRFDKVFFVETPKGWFLTQYDYYNYAVIAKNMILENGKFYNMSGGLL